MELLLFFLIVGGLFVLVMRGGPGPPSDGLRMNLVPVASTLGLEPELTMGGRTWRAEGRLQTEAGEMQVLVEHDTLLREIRVEIDYPALSERPMMLRRLAAQAPDPPPPAEAWNLIYSRVRTGDPDFDRWFVIEGGAARVASALDAETRRVALEASALAEMELAGGYLSWKRPASEELAGEWIRDELPRLKTLLERLALPSEQWPARLLVGGADEAAASARLIRLGLLLVDDGVDAQSREQAERLAAADADPRVRALIEVTEASTRTLIIQSAAAHAEGRAAALRALVNDLEPALAEAFVSSALESPTLLERLEAITAVQRPGLRSLLPSVIAEVDEADARTAIPLIETLERLGGAEAEEALLRLVGSKAHDVAVRACTALGRCGSPDCISALRELVDGKRQDNLTQELRRVTSEIQARFGLQAGRLSLAPSQAPAGALTEAASTGALCATPADEGALSVAPAGSEPHPPDAT